VVAEPLERDLRTEMVNDDATEMVVQREVSW
jgi:hypothetical protein